MSIDYYNQNAQLFYDATAHIDMQAFTSRFLANLPKGSHILDAGCGSGRDSRYFEQQGYLVTAFDASEELVRLAQSSLNTTVQTCTFKSFQAKQPFDGIWACASLLHVPLKELSQTFEHLTQFLKPHGTFYCSFKYGEQVTQRGNRTFTDCNEKLLMSVLEDTDLKLTEFWITQDLRPGREDELWLNALLSKKA
jgi:cyclopropane fatty-acyl-phospholipid synthase-like methyltransferase